MSRNLGGGGMNYQKGYFTDTTSIAGGGTYTKTVTLDRSDYKSVHARFASNGSPSYDSSGGIVIGGTAAIDGTGWCYRAGAPYTQGGNKRVQASISRPVTGGAGEGLSGNPDLYLHECYINGNQLTFVWKNSEGSTARSLSISVQWEVLG